MPETVSGPIPVHDAKRDAMTEVRRQQTLLKTGAVLPEPL
jgi:hypothetical protein